MNDVGMVATIGPGVQPVEAELAGSSASESSTRNGSGKTPWPYELRSVEAVKKSVACVRRGGRIVA